MSLICGSIKILIILVFHWILFQQRFRTRWKQSYQSETGFSYISPYTPIQSFYFHFYSLSYWIRYALGAKMVPEQAENSSDGNYSLSSWLKRNSCSTWEFIWHTQRYFYLWFYIIISTNFFSSDHPLYQVIIRMVKYK